MIGAVATTFGVGLWPLVAVPVSLALVAVLLALLASAERWLTTGEPAEEAAGVLQRSALEVQATEVRADQVVAPAEARAVPGEHAEIDLEPAIY